MLKNSLGGKYGSLFIRCCSSRCLTSSQRNAFPPAWSQNESLMLAADRETLKPPCYYWIQFGGKIVIWEILQSGFCFSSKMVKTHILYIYWERLSNSVHPVFQLVSLVGIIIVEQLKDSSRKNPGFLSHFFKGLVYWQFPFSHKTNSVPLQMGPLNM